MRIPELSTWKYILTIEEDNIPPPDGLLKLYEDMDEFDVVGGLYWTKGEGGQPMIYGDPLVGGPELSRRRYPKRTRSSRRTASAWDSIFSRSIFSKMKICRGRSLGRVQDFDPQQRSAAYTQDLYFYENAGKLGYKFACDTRVKVGHYDAAMDIVW